MRRNIKTIVTLTLVAVIALFLSVNVPQGQEKGKMIYLVTMESVETGEMHPPQQAIQFVEQMVIPSLEALAKMEAEKKILAGGIVAGARAAVFIVQASSNEELSRLLQSLPIWGIVKVDVTPLQSFKDRTNQDRELIEHLKAALK